VVLVEFKWSSGETDQNGVYSTADHAQQQNIAQHIAEDGPNQKGGENGLVKGGKVKAIRLLHHHGKCAGTAADNETRHEQYILDQSVVHNVHPFASLEKLDGFFSRFGKVVAVCG